MYNNDSSIYYHRLTHKNIKKHECHICQKKFLQAGMLKLHMVKHTNERPFTCDTCSKTFKSKPSLKLHMKAQHSEKVVAQCLDCNIDFTTTFRYKAHINLKHKRSHICHICGLQLSDAATLKSHLTTHVSEEELNKNGVECEFCKKKFVNQSKMKIHRRRVHEMEKRSYICDLCGKSLTSATSLRDHKLVHMGIKEHKCNFCENSFAKKNTLKIHLLTHTGQKPHECKICGSRFSQYGPLKRHMMAHEATKILNPN